MAEEAVVSKATLYNHTELKERINFLRNQQEKAFVDSRIKRVFFAEKKYRVEQYI